MSDFRPNKDSYYWNIAKEVAQRSTCMSVKGGAVIVNGDQIIATGYVGAPRGIRDCYERGNCFRREHNIPSGHRYELCRSVHAEQNAIINAARAGVSTVNGTIYLYFVKRSSTGEDKFVNALPCSWCKRTVINSGLLRFVGNDEDGNLKSFNINDWIKEWDEGDIIDKIAYDSKYTNEEFKKNSNINSCCSND